MKKAILFLILSMNTFSADFNTSFDKTIKYEGSTVFRSKFGEVSKYGITKNTLKLYNKTNSTTYEVEQINKEIAKRIYKERYWNSMKLTQLNNQSLANHIFDYGVNSGIYKASSDLQDTCNELIEEHGINIPKITKDGIVGSETIKTLNEILQHLEEETIINKYKNKRLSFLKRLGAKWNTYGKGWTTRVNTL